jgi:valyl-tRNA synthetase
MAKIPLYRAGDGAARRQAQETLVTVLETTLRLLHPFMPFITEEIWQRLPEHGESIMLAPYPKVARGQADAAAERDMAVVMDVVTAMRNIRGEMRISPATTLTVTVRPAPEHAAVIGASSALIESLARVQLSIDPAALRPAGSALAVVRGSEIYVSLEGVVDVAAERARLDKEIRKVTEAVGFLEGKLARPEFVERAPAEIVDKERQRLAEQQAVREKLEASLAWISGSA